MRSSSTLVCLLLAACGEQALEHPPSREAESPSAAEPEAAPASEPDEDVPPAAPTAGPDAHAWAELAFVDVDDAFGAGTILEARLFAEGERGIQLRVTARWIEEDVLEDARFALHLPDGTVVAPEADALGLMGAGTRGDGPRRVASRGARFGWRVSSLDEAWIELDLAAHGRYWLEVPYGFVRDPSAPLDAGDARARPALAGAMAQLSARDRIVPFRHARYDAGEIQNGWRLEVLASNPFDPHVELVLYRDDGRVGESAYRWDLHEPRTSLAIVGHTGGRRPGMPTAARLHEDGLRRSDHFHVFGRPSGRRGWGTIAVTIEDRLVEVRVPSSLYLYTHGTADPYHERRTASAAEVLGGELF